MSYFLRVKNSLIRTEDAILSMSEHVAALCHGAMEDRVEKGTLISTGGASFLLQLVKREKRAEDFYRARYGGAWRGIRLNREEEAEESCLYTAVGATGSGGGR